MTVKPGVTLRRTDKSVPAGYIVGRSTGGVGPAQLLSVDDIARQAMNQGAVAPSGNTGITQLTGDVTAGPGNGSQIATIAATTVTPGAYRNANLTVGADGRLTAASTGGWTLAASWTYASDITQKDFTGLAAYQEILVLARLVTLSVSGTIALRASVDNGINFLSTSGDYVTVTTAGVEANATFAAGYATAATAARSCTFDIAAFNSTSPKIVIPMDAPIILIPTGSALNAVRVLPSAGGNLTGGNIYVFGR